MDDASIQRFGLALTVAGATFHLQAVAQYPQTGWATFGGVLLFVGLAATASPFVSLSSGDASSGEEQADTDD
ncbi:hypothetical protein [Haloferax profundi]|uniref:Uncharacterized protein n=1 Tax=Haloferax profundi TaxID=1544718 RepID=A0A0W1RVZ2_9EURY|nr:hypothetical protein [Haloferax profundi]KTG17730.1 hypothetical protein AUR66_02675 [Haloferax profundi]